MKLQLLADVARMWQLELKATYSSGCYGALAVREAFQNSSDAIRKGKIEDGIFNVVLSKENDMNIVDIVDNAGGMDEKTLQEKFLTLGVSGKSEDGESVGGFGVAKAVILGSADKGWEIKSRNFVLRSKTMETEELPPSAYHHGMGIKLKISDLNHRRFKEDICIYLGLSKPKANVALNGFVTGYADFGRGKSVETNAHCWGDSIVKITQYNKKAIQVPTIEGSFCFNLSLHGCIVVRLNGLVQFYEPIYGVNNTLLIVDVQPKCRPGEDGYPFTKGRDGFKDKARQSFYEIQKYLERESLSSKNIDEWKEVKFKKKKEEVQHEEVNNRLEQSSPLKIKFAITNPELILDPTKEAYMIKEVVDDRENILCHHSTIEKDDFTELNPVNFEWILRKAKGIKRKFVLDSEDNICFLNLWNDILVILVKAMDITTTVYPGIVLDDSSVAQNYSKDGNTYMLANPMFILREFSPEQASFLGVNIWQTLCHEIAHIDHKDHDERFSSAREHLSTKTSHMIHEFMKLGEKYFGRIKKSQTKAIKTLIALGYKKDLAEAMVRKTSPEKINELLKRIKNVS